MRTQFRFAARQSSLLLALAAALLSTTASSQGLTWGRFETAVPFGSGSTNTTQTLPAQFSGLGPGSGTATLTLSVSGGSNAWNGFGIARNDDGYYPAPNQPQPGITFINGAPGFGGGIPALAAVSFSAGYNLAGAPPTTPAPPSDRAALYFDAADGTTATLQWNFATLNGSVLPAGSWLFLDSVDQGERVVISGPAGWISSVHSGDSSLPRPPPPVPVPVTVSAPTFPACTPGITQNATTLTLDGRYGDISAVVPTCSNVPVPVPGQTVGYTKGVDAVGVWVRTAVNLSSLSMTVIDTDPSTSNGSGGFTGPDNNYFMGVGVISLTRGVTPTVIPTLGHWGLGALLLCLVLGTGAFVPRSTRP